MALDSVTKKEMQALKAEMENRGKSDLSKLMIEQWCSTVSGIRHDRIKKDDHDIEYFNGRLIPILARIMGLENELDMSLILPILRNDFQSITGVIEALKQIDKNDFYIKSRNVVDHFRESF